MTAIKEILAMVLLIPVLVQSQTMIVSIVSDDMIIVGADSRRSVPIKSALNE